MKKLKLKKIKMIAVCLCILTSSSLMAANLDFSNTIDIDNSNSISGVFSEEDFLNSFSIENQHNNAINLAKESYTKILNLIKENKLSEAKHEIDLSIKEQPDQAAFFNLKALVATLEKDNSNAIKDYKKALELDTNNIMAHLGLATLSLESKNLKSAKKHAELALSINDQAATAYLLLADITNKQSNIQEAEKVILNALPKVKGNVNAEIKLVTSLIKLYVFQKRPTDILDLTQKLKDQYPENTKTLSLLARAQMLNKQNDLAEQTLNQVIKQDRQDAENRILLASLLKNTPEKSKETLQLLNEASIIENNNPRAATYKTIYLIQLKRLDDALKNAKEITAKFPQLAIGKTLEADVYLIEKKFAQALETKLQAYQIQASDKLASTIVSLMINQDQKGKAIDFLNQALSKNPKDSGLHFKLASIYQMDKDYSSAVKHYKAILDESPQNAITLNNLAWVYAQQNNPEALAIAKKAYTINPESVSILDTYGVILNKKGQNEEAISILKKAVKLAPNYYDIQLHLAEAYATSGDKKQAITILKSILTDEKSFAEKDSATKLFNTLKAN